jgi:hypothetical protein
MRVMLLNTKDLDTPTSPAIQLLECQELFTIFTKGDRRGIPSDNAARIDRKRRPTHPGVILREDVLPALNMN